MLEIFILFCFKNVHSKHIRTLFLPMNLSCLRTKHIRLPNGDEVARVPRLLKTERNEGENKFFVLSYSMCLTWSIGY